MSGIFDCIWIGFGLDNRVFDCIAENFRLILLNSCHFISSGVELLTMKHFLKINCSIFFRLTFKMTLFDIDYANLMKAYYL